MENGDCLRNDYSKSSNIKGITYINLDKHNHLKIKNAAKCGWQSPLWIILLAGQILMYGVYSIVVDLSKQNGEIPYLSSSSVLSTETLKLLICLVTLWPEVRARKLPVFKLRAVLPFALPAVCYCVNNNLAVFMQTQMDPATYMVLGNMKIVSTAVLYRLIMKRSMGYLKWMAVLLLTCGGVFNSISALRSRTLSLSEIHLTPLGLGSLCCYCFISGFAGVFTEYILKKDQIVSIYYQNALLYIFGILLNFLMWSMQACHVYAVSKNYEHFYLFHGYSVFTWTLIVTQAASGVIMSLIMKYQNNLVRLFVIATAPLITTLMSLYLFGLRVHSEFLLSACFIIIAALLYNYPRKD